ncbi:glycosyltransferase family 4 protein [Methylophaga sp. OBS3]|uniref:glycosyltransferase family 4 protein n=1 Tax=Methylophaga sp. OBS3 TaxID=2991934 RepID=UPI002250EA31|nr:glycosyltransferase family 4 protein [Methylophaga sp. OBS3]MCX4189097.1 glycosyltransferase family 4 protein [Methylophaga sp. OBS3]
MRKYCIVAAAYPPNIKGGGEKSTQLLAKGLSALGNDVTVLTIDHEEGQYMDNDVLVKTIRTPNIYWNFKHTQPAHKKLIWHFKENFNPQAIQTIESKLESINPDAVITSTIENFGNAAWEACNKLNIPVAHILRSYYTLCFKGTMFRNDKNCEGRCLGCQVGTMGRVNSAGKVNGLIGISDFILQKHIPYFKNAMNTVIFNPVETATPAHQELDNSEKVFGYLGRIEPEKGVELLLQAFQTLPEDYHLKIAGTGKEEYVQYLKDKYPSNRITFLGWVSADEVYQAVNFVIVPSMWNEPFGRTVIEAYAQGVAVIASARGGLKELVVEGETGQLFEPNDVENLKDACLAAVSNNLASAEVSHKLKQYAEQFSVSNISVQYDVFINQMIDAYESAHRTVLV